MKINIKSIGFRVKAHLADFVNKKVVKLSQFYDQIISIEITFSTEKSHTKENKICDIRLVIPGNDLLAHAQSTTFEKGVDKCIDVLIKQIEKKKNKHIEHEKAEAI